MISNKEEPIKGEILLIDKPKDYTSARVVNIIKKKLNVKKAGHSGTLDPKASGLMIIGTYKMTKYLGELLETDKEYEGLMILGESTASFDSETEVIKRSNLENIDTQIVRAMFKNFTGEMEQIPPMYSAIKFNGKPLYKFARKNVEIDRKSRKVFIKEFEPKRIELPEVEFRVVCSKGTYIRSLVNDFGEKLGTGAYLKELRRTRIGKFDVKDSITLETFLNNYHETN